MYRITCYNGETDENETLEVDFVDGGICETILWDARDRIDPPYRGYIMFASSCPDINVPHLVNEMGIDESEITIMEIAGHETIWYKEE